MKKRHPYQQTNDEWRIPPASRNMGCCSADIYNAMYLLSSLESIDPEKFGRGGGGLLSSSELIASIGVTLASHFHRMEEDCNNAGVTSADYREWANIMGSITTAQDAVTKAVQVNEAMGTKLRNSAHEGNCK
tara:strand:- start:2389 stop:2784 length:396 start_codon:yes stop_codon:yes gene_type:complete